MGTRFLFVTGKWNCNLVPFLRKPVTHFLSITVLLLPNRLTRLTRRVLTLGSGSPSDPATAPLQDQANYGKGSTCGINAPEAKVSVFGF